MRIPLSSGFTAFALVGFIISLFFTLFGRVSPTWGFLLIFMFVIFIISSMMSAFPDKDDL